MSLFDNSIGIIGNIEKSLLEILHANNNLIFEERDRKQEDASNREAVEQSLTELYLDGIQAQQDITDIQLQLLEG